MSRWYPCIYCTEDLHCTKYSDDSCESWCVLGPCTAETPSNGDKIRLMTDEELAEWIIKHDCHIILYGYDPKAAVLDWLKQEAEE